MRQDELYHHGILGQKWGIRRFQNEDGTRTEAGKKRRKENELEDLSELSDAEVQQKLNRTRNEVQYYQEKAKLDKIKRGKTTTDKILEKINKSSQTMNATTGVINAADKLSKAAQVAVVASALASVGNIVLRKAARKRNPFADGLMAGTDFVMK